MTRKQIEALTKTHEAQRQDARRKLKSVLDQEADGRETKWAKELIIHTAMLDWLKGIKPEDE